MGRKKLRIMICMRKSRWDSDGRDRGKGIFDRQGWGRDHGQVQASTSALHEDQDIVEANLSFLVGNDDKTPKNGGQ